MKREESEREKKEKASRQRHKSISCVLVLMWSQQKKVSHSEGLADAKYHPAEPDNGDDE